MIADEGTAAAVLQCIYFTFRFQHGLGHFLNEQRNAISALDNVLSNTLRQWLVAGDAVNHCAHFALIEAIEAECSDVGSSDPGRLEFPSVWTISNTPSPLQPINCATERLQARWVDPMHVLENH